MALTFPSLPLSPHTTAAGRTLDSLRGSPHLSSPSGLRGLLAPSNRYSVLLPLALSVLCGALNLAVLGPMTTQTMRERKHQETRDGKKSYDAGEQSAEMQRLNSRFGWLHGVSTVVNMVELGALLGYGFTIAGWVLH